MKYFITSVIACVVLSLTDLSALAAPPVLDVDGQPFFPIGWYDSRSFSSVTSAAQAYAVYPTQGMNTVLLAYGHWLGEPVATTVPLLGASWNGLKMMVEVHGYAVQEQPGYPLSLIDDQVNMLKSHSAFLGYYLADEPELRGVSVSMLQDRYAQIKARDPDHPIFVAHANDFGGSYLAVEPPLYTDAVMADRYVVLDGSVEFINPMYLVARESRYYSQLAEANGKSAFISIVQAHSADGTFGLRSPTFAEQRYLSYAPIVEGARGLFYWMHHYTTEDYRANVVAPIAMQIQSLVPAIISNATDVTITSSHDTDTTGHGIEHVTYLYGRDAEGGYLIAVNNRNAVVSVDFTLHADVLDELAEVLFEGRSVAVSDLGDGVWQFSDNFSPYDVNIYRILTIPEPACGLIAFAGWVVMGRLSTRSRPAKKK